MKNLFSMTVACLLFMGVAGNADEFDTDKYVRSFDKNRSQRLELSELVSLEADARAANTADKQGVLVQSRVLLKEYAETGGIPVLAFSPQPDRTKCVDQRFFLRKDVTSVAVLECSGSRAPSSGATFSFVRDEVTDASTVAVLGGVGVVIGKPIIRTPGPEDDKLSFRLDELAFLGFAEINGKFANTGPDSGYLRTGLKSELYFTGGGLASLDASIIGYHQSDLEFAGNGYGAAVTLVPRTAKLKINSYVRGPSDKTEFHWITKGLVDGFFVDDPGRSNLMAGQGYIWLGGILGFEYKDETLWEKGIVLKATVTGAWDMVSGTEAILWGANLDFLLDEKGATSLNINYERGENRQDLVFKDKVTVGFGLKF